MTYQQALAITGIGCRFPGGVSDLESYWQLLINRGTGITEVPADRWNSHKYYHPDPEIPTRMVTKWGGFLDQHDQFDGQFFGISPREINQMDVQQRWLLETSWEALEDAGIAPSGLRGSKVGVFVGISSHDVLDAMRGDLTHVDIHTGTGNALSIAANRLSFYYDFKGPSMAVDTACSSALVAVQLACQSIWAGDSTMALAGGVNAIANPNISIGFSRASMLSPTGTCFAFDHRANGYVRSEGVGVVVIKPLAQALADGDRIHAVIRAAVVNQDGHSSSLTIPSMTAQEAMLRDAYQQAGVDPCEVAYIEAHGTGTPVGDPIEARALGHVLGANRAADDPCLIGSVKTNIGHLESASGMAGLIKACLILQHQIIPAHLNFEKANTHIGIEEIGLEVVSEVRDLPRRGDQPAIVGVNSFGFGGTNAHVVLEQPPSTQKDAPSHLEADRPYMLPISAADETGLRAQVEAYLSVVQPDEVSLAQISAAAGIRRDALHQRLVVIGADRDEMRSGLLSYLNRSASFPHTVIGTPAADLAAPVFVFTGQGAQWWRMGQQLMAREPIFRQALEQIDAMLSSLGGASLIEEMLRDEQNSRIDDTDIAQPAIFALQVGLAALWASWGIHPSKVIGHSVGEVAAAYIAGIYSLADAVTIIHHRSRLQHQTGGHGAMIAVGVTPAEAEVGINSHHDVIQLAASNSPSMVTLSGDRESVEALAAQFEAAGKFVRRLPINYAFHSYQMDAIQTELLAVLDGIQPMVGSIPFISTVTGSEIAGETMGAAYWWDNVRQPVCFAEAVSTLIDAGDTTFLELGPHPALQNPIMDCLTSQGKQGHVFHSLRHDADDSMEMLGNLAALHIAGHAVNWAAVNQADRRHVSLPMYRWQHQTYRLESKVRSFHDLEPYDHPLLGMRISAPNPTWQLELDPRVLGWLLDHKLWDNIVFPAAGYAEMALAIARLLFPSDSYTVEALRMKKALFVSTNQLPTLQIIFDPSDKSVSIYSSVGEKTEWHLHARGVLRPLPDPAPQSIDLDRLRETLGFLSDSEVFYHVAHAAGYQWGPEFQQIKQVWGGSGHALAEIAVTQAVQDQSADYHLHPALLDACAQTFSAAGEFAKWIGRGENTPFLPAGYDRIHLLTTAALPACLWADTHILSETEQSVVGNTYLYDDNGTLLAELQGIRFDRVVQKSPSVKDGDTRFYQFHWQRKRLKGAPLARATFAALPSIMAAVAQQMPALHEQYPLEAYFNDFVPEIEIITLHLVQNTLLDLGWDVPLRQVFSLDGLMLDLGILGRYRSLVALHLQALTEAGLLRAEGSECWEVVGQLYGADVEGLLDIVLEAHPNTGVEITLVRALATTMPQILRGRVDPHTLFAPDDRANAMYKYYHTSASQLASYRLVRTALTAALDPLQNDRPLRVLALGAGAEALTAAVLDALPPERTEYTLTGTTKQISEARQQFSGFDFVAYAVFELASDAESSLDPHGYDVIVVANERPTAAGAACLAGLLAEGGLLIMMEAESPPLALETLYRLIEAGEAGRWQPLLHQGGFGEASDLALHNTRSHVLTLARAPEISGGQDVQTLPSSALLFADQQGVSDALHRELTTAGKRVIRVVAGSSFLELEADTYTIDPAQEADLITLLATIQQDGMPLTTIIDTWALDQPSMDELMSADLMLGQQSGVLHALRLARALDAAKLATPPQVFFVSRDTQHVLETDRSDGLHSAPLIGFLRVANNEMPAHHWHLIDLDDKHDADQAQNILNEVLSPDSELEIAYRDGWRYVNRLWHLKPDVLPPLLHPTDSDTPFRLQFDKPGMLTNLSLNQTMRRAPEAGEIEVRVKAGGLNFRDVMKVLGMYPGNPADLTWLGDDFAGTVIRTGTDAAFQIGDDVVGLAPYAFRSHLTVDQRAVFKQPNFMSFEEAATLPTVFLTAYYAIVQLAQMRAGERILIHAGTGGVGQAAIQIAQDIGLEIIATAGSPEKRALLRDQGIEHVFDSRTLAFADDVMRVTQEQGVDAVLNSLAGDFIPKNFSVLAPFGRYLEIGKVDVYANSKVGLEALRNNIAVFIIDLAQLMEHRPHEFARMIDALRAKFEQGIYRPIPHRTFPIDEAVEAFRYMASGKHIGKNVLSFETEGIRIGPITEASALFRADASYLITGGAGGFGLEVAQWMAQQGARHLVLMSRSGPPDDAARDKIDRMRANGISVINARGDVTREADVVRLIEQVQVSGAPLAGVIHGAMVLHDSLISSLTEDMFNTAFLPKMLGAWNLHCATLHLALDHFICFSSISSIIGTGGQANYSAGNAFLDALASYRRARGLAGLTINWGVIGGAGVVARNAEAGRYLEAVGVKAISLPAALGFLQTMLTLDAGQVCIASADWTVLSRYLFWVANSGVFDALTHHGSTGGADGEIRAQIIAALSEDRQDLVEVFLSRMVAKVLNTSADQIDRTLSLTYFGLDSLMTIELINTITSQLDLTLTVSDVLSSATIRDMSAVIVDRVMATAGDANGTNATGLLNGSDPDVDLVEESRLSDDIYADDTLTPAQIPASTILLTGATGFLGAFLLADLLRYTDAQVQCLVRAADSDEGMRRLRENLERYGLWNDRLGARIVPVVGDLGLPRFGLSHAEYQALAEQVDVIYHNGAVLNLIQPFAALKATNVSGVEEVLRLASQTRLKHVHYISTIAVFFATSTKRDRVVHESDHPTMDGLYGGYVQSKWAAERLIRQAQDRGIPCTIYRPGLITGDSQTGVTNTEDLASRLVKGSFQLGMIPDHNISANIVPVDYVSRGIVHLAGLPQTAGQVFHLTHPQPTPLSQLIDWASSARYLRKVTYRDWRAALNQQAQQRIENDLLPLLPLFPLDRPEQIEQQIECEHTISLLNASGIECAPIDARLVRVYADYLISAGFLEAAP